MLSPWPDEPSLGQGFDPLLLSCWIPCQTLVEPFYSKQVTSFQRRFLCGSSFLIARSKLMNAVSFLCCISCTSYLFLPFLSTRTYSKRSVLSLCIFQLRFSPEMTISLFSLLSDNFLLGWRMVLLTTLPGQSYRAKPKSNSSLFLNCLCFHYFGLQATHVQFLFQLYLTRLYRTSRQARLHQRRHAPSLFSVFSDTSSLGGQNHDPSHDWYLGRTWNAYDIHTSCPDHYWFFSHFLS